MSFAIDHIILYNERGLVEFQGSLYIRQFNSWININKYNMGDKFLDNVKCFKNCNIVKIVGEPLLNCLISFLFKGLHFWQNARMNFKITKSETWWFCWNFMPSECIKPSTTCINNNIFLWVNNLPYIDKILKYLKILENINWMATWSPCTTQWHYSL